ncbi:MAG: hypothetical protein J6M02_00820 [Clostridia bacterium]|nr:hypothetical protein [Clostridia bacterium]
MKKFIAIFLVLTLFFNMNTVAFADGNIINALETTDPNQSLGFTAIQNNSESSNGELKIVAGKISGLLKTGWDLVTGFLTWCQSPLQGIVNLFPSVENFVFGKSQNSFGEISTSPFQLTFFSQDASGLAGAIQSTTASVYNALRYLVTSIYIIILVYLAVRILLSSIGRQKAHYKALFQYWLTGLLMLFSFHWVMAFIIWLSDILTEIFASIASSASLPASTSTLNSYLAIELPTTSGTVAVLIFGQILQILIFLAVLVAALLIGFIYLKRLLFVALLIIVFPLVVLSYVFDKIGDRKSQTFNLWLKEFATNVFVQPIHALLLAFIILLIHPGTGLNFFQIPIIGPILAVAMLYLLPSGEKFLKQLFQISSSMGVGGGVMHTLAHQSLAMRQIKDMASPITKRVSQGLALNKMLKSQGITGGKLSDRMKDTKEALGTLSGFHGIKGIKETGKGIANNVGGIYQAARGLSGSTQRQKQLEGIAKSDDTRYKKINEQIKKLTDKGSYEEAYQSNISGTLGALPGLAVGSGFAVMGDWQHGIMAAGFVGKHGANWAENKFSGTEKNYAQLIDKIEASGLEGLSDAEREKIAKIYGGEKNIPSKTEVLQDLEFKRRTAKYGSSGDPVLDSMALPSQRNKREKVFGENGILNTDEKNNYDVEIDNKNMTLTSKDGKEKITLLGEGDSSLKHSIKMPASGIGSAGQKAQILEASLDKIANDAGITEANGYTPEKIEKFKERKRADVLDEIDTVSNKLDTLRDRPPIMKTVKPNKAINLSIASDKKIDTFEALENARMHPEENLLTADEMNQISNQTVASVDKTVHQPYLNSIKTKTKIAPKFDTILTDHNIDPTTYEILDPSQKADFAGAMQKFHNIDSSVSANRYQDLNIQQVQGVGNLLKNPPQTFGITNADYDSITQKAVTQAQSIQNTAHAKQIIQDAVQNPSAYGISTEERDEILKANHINPITMEPYDRRRITPQNFTAAATGLQELQKYRNPYNGTVIQAANDIEHGTVRYERAQATLSADQLGALQNAGPLQMTYFGSDVKITPVMNPSASITVPSGITLPTGETVVKSAVVDPLNPEQLLQTYADVDRFTLDQPSYAAPSTGTPYEMDAIDQSKLPASGQFSMIRSGDYCIISNQAGDIVYSQRGLTVIPDTHSVSLSRHTDTDGNVKYIIDSNSPVTADMVTELKRKADLLKARSIGSSDVEAKNQAILAQSLMADLASKLGLHVSK